MSDDMRRVGCLRCGERLIDLDGSEPMCPDCRVLDRVGASPAVHGREEVNELAQWLLARVAEDEQAANAAAVEGAHWQSESHGSVWSDDPEADPAMPVTYAEGRPLAEQAAHIARHDPARVLADCQARRAIIGLHTATWSEGDAVPEYGTHLATVTQYYRDRRV